MFFKVLISDPGYAAAVFAGEYLRRHGWELACKPDGSITHLLLPTPCRKSDGELQHLLQQLPETVTLIGGNLDREILAGYPRLDLLKDETYLACNAAITAHCAIQCITRNLPVILSRQRVLIFGWGRIAKCLARLLSAMDAEVTIAARKEAHRAEAESLLFHAVDLVAASEQLADYRVICNTIPVPVLTAAQTAICKKDAVLLDLASVSGILDARVISARGLPGKLAPESSGNLIGQTVLRLSTPPAAKKEE